MHTDKAVDDKIQRSGNASIAIKLKDAQELNCVWKDEQGSTLKVRSILRKVGDPSTKEWSCGMTLSKAFSLGTVQLGF